MQFMLKDRRKNNLKKLCPGQSKNKNKFNHGKLCSSKRANVLTSFVWKDFFHIKYIISWITHQKLEQCLFTIFPNFSWRFWAIKKPEISEKIFYLNSKSCCLNLLRSQHTDYSQDLVWSRKSQKLIFSKDVPKIIEPGKSTLKSYS